jgi:hypothetical protein
MIRVVIHRHEAPPTTVMVDADAMNMAAAEEDYQGQATTLLILRKGDEEVAFFSQWSYAVKEEALAR